MTEQRKFHALRAHIDDLLANGARILGRMPLRLDVRGHVYTVSHGMLISQDLAA